MQVLIAIVVSWVTAQTFKLIFALVRRERIDVPKILASGGMPSTHSSVVASAAVIIGCQSGFLSNVFAICLVFALVVMFDAMNVRRAAGELGESFNRALRRIYKDDEELISENEVDAPQGHTLSEVAAGAGIGACVGMIIGVVSFGAPALFK